jgi:hypothetical protein
VRSKDGRKEGKEGTRERREEGKGRGWVVVFEASEEEKLIRN